ncbi:MAG: hypothetical protein C0432_03825 [Candidatus Puniceispirillum sp.]|nr:hypothetical protein [Candidatus Pelagibacter sp.]MBA4283404.1 hypothetical protein [Candidatus Puniceispirillum sp.]
MISFALRYIFFCFFVFCLNNVLASEQKDNAKSEKVYEFFEDSSSDDNDQNEACYYLGGILLKDLKSWDVWLNGQVYSKDTEIKYMEIVFIEDSSIFVRPFSKKHKKREIKKLEVGQTYCPLSHTILSGDHRH